MVFLYTAVAAAAAAVSVGLWAVLDGSPLTDGVNKRVCNKGAVKDEKTRTKRSCLAV